MTDFLLIRHGETDWNRELRFQGSIDISLNDIGQLQAQRLKKRFIQTLAQWRADKREIHGVVSSVLQRAHQTAKPVGRRSARWGWGRPRRGDNSARCASWAAR